MSILHRTPLEETYLQLCDALVDHDIDDPEWGPPESWAPWTDEEGVFSLEGDVDTPDGETPDPEQIPGLPGGLPGLPGEEIPLDPRQPDPDDEPAEGDPDDLADWLERQRWESGCRMRFA